MTDNSGLQLNQFTGLITFHSTKQAMNLERWEHLMQVWELAKNKATYNALCNAYAGKGRYYHTAEHIQACLKYLDNISNLTDSSKEIEMALWFHDAIYNPYASDNELKSAQWASDFLRRNKINPELTSQVQRLIMATRHTGQSNLHDESILTDIDLSILGSKAETYKQFETAIRKEYQQIPFLIYKKKRKKILNGFLSREPIYQNQYFQQRLEKQARENINNAILSLS